LRAAIEDDIELLVGWHRDPDVSRFWDDEIFTPSEIRERLEGGDVDAYIVEADGVPIGYAQTWRSDDGRGGGLDMFLIPTARGVGYGPDAARALATYLRDEAGWTEITVDPYLWNEQAIRAWERAGFVRVGERQADDVHSSSWLMMRFAEPV
jgi:aminoglycoside 6'-N-acetyltransferase